MIGNSSEKNPIWCTMMEKPEIPSEGMKNLSHMEQSQTELMVLVPGSGRLQSEIS
jgi:hypothetical protein